MSTTPPNRPPFDPNAPFDPANGNVPRYDQRYDPRWQKEQQRFFRDQQRMSDRQSRAQQRAAAAAWKVQARAQRNQWKMYWDAQRRTSLAGPILIIAVGGVIFLIHSGRLPAAGFFTWYAHWWPLLLIGIGVLKLAEWSIDRATAPANAPAPRYTLGGGVVFLIVLLALTGLATHTIEWHWNNNDHSFFGLGNENIEHLFGQKHEEDSAPVLHTIAAGGTLSIVNAHGDVSVTGTSDDDQIHLSVHKEVFTNTDDVATERLREISPVFEGDSSNLTLRVPSVQGGSANVTLLVPPTTHVLLNNTHGDVHVTNIKAPLAVTADNGDVEVVAITGPVQVHSNSRHHDIGVRSVSGDVALDGTGNDVNVSDITGNATVRGDFFGSSSMQRISGSVAYTSSRTDVNFTHIYGDFSIDNDSIEADQVVGPALVQTRSRDITLSKISGEFKVANNHGDIKIDTAPPVGAMTIDNQNGSVTVTLPEKSRFELHAETSDGDTHSDFSPISSDGHGAMNGTVNGGGPSVRINTSHGDISISRNIAMPITPPPSAPRLSGFGGVPSPPAPPAVPAVPHFGSLTEGTNQHDKDARARGRSHQERAEAGEAGG